MGLREMQRRWAEKRNGAYQIKRINVMGARSAEAALASALAEGWSVERTEPFQIEGTSWGTTYILIRPRKRD